MSKRNKIVLTLLIILTALSFALFYTEIDHPVVIFTYVSIFTSLLYVLTALILKAEPPGMKTAVILAAAGLVLRIMLIPVEPAASDDVYRYLWDGKVQAAGINPYEFSPSDDTLNFLHSESLPDKVSFPHIKTIYPPYSQLIFSVNQMIFDTSISGLKVFYLLHEAVIILLLILILRKLDKPPGLSALYALCPLPIMQFFIDAHHDVLGITWLVLFIYFFMQRRRILSYGSLALSILSKLISAMAAPLAAFNHDKKRAGALLLPLLFAAVIYIPYFSGGVFPFESLITFSSEWYFNGSIYKILLLITGDGLSARIISGVFFIAVYGYLIFSRMNFIEKIYFAFFFFFLFAPTLNAWYITWTAALLALNFRYSGLTLVAMISLSNIIYIDYILTGVWQESSFITILEYLPVYLLLAVEVGRRFRRWRQTPRSPS